MSARIDQLTRPGWRFWFLWILAAVVGAMVGWVLSRQLDSILVTALGTNGTGPRSAPETALLLALRGVEGGVVGLGMGLGQWWVFRKHLKQMGWWILATGLALVAQSLFASSLPSDTPPWRVAVSTTLSVGVFVGLCQWFVLHGRVSHAGWWIAVSILGYVPVLIPLAAAEFTQFQIEPSLRMVFLAVASLVPFAVAGGGMIWLLRQTAHASQAIAS